MSDEQFADARARYDAGERTLMEVEEERTPITGAADGAALEGEALGLANAALDLQEHAGLYITSQ